jgi:hypothetical protein
MCLWMTVDRPLVSYFIASLDRLVTRRTKTDRGQHRGLEIGGGCERVEVSGLAMAFGFGNLVLTNTALGSTFSDFGYSLLVR